MKKVLLFLIAYIVIFSPCDAQQWLWAKYGIGDGFGESIKADTKGNCYLSGAFFNDTIVFGKDTLRNSSVTNPPYSNSLDAFIIKYNMLWFSSW